VSSRTKSRFGAQGAGLLRRHPRHQGCGCRHRGQDRHRLHRPVGLRQVDLPALPQPDERHHRHLPGRGATSSSTARTSTTPRSTRCSCAPRSAWCSRSPTRSRSRSTTTSPTARASTAGHQQGRSRRDRRKALRRGGALGRGQGPPRRARHRPVRRPAAAPVHRPRHRDRARGAADGRALLGARPDRHRQVEELIDELRENYSVVIVTHSMQQAARVSQKTAFFHLGNLVEYGETEQIFTNPQDERRKATSPAGSGRAGHDQERTHISPRPSTATSSDPGADHEDGRAGRKHRATPPSALELRDEELAEQVRAATCRSTRWKTESTRRPRGSSRCVSRSPPTCARC
jgi:hypothetical protein